MASIPPNLASCTHRYALFVSYVGSRYLGSQRQISRKEEGTQDTIQESIECSLENLIPLGNCRLTPASRTDKGVHALMNCYTLPLMETKFPTEAIKYHANDNLMKMRHDIIVNDVVLVPIEFHPRKDAISREYIYRIAVMKNSRAIFGSKHHDPLKLNHLLPVTELFKVLPLPCLDYDKMLEAVDIIKGEHDFRCFANKPAETEDTIRNVDISISEIEPVRIDQTKDDSYVLYQLSFKSRAFLWNQIRRIVGAIITYATYSRINTKDISNLIEKADPNYWKPSMIIAEPWGLFLSKINYDKSSFEGRSFRTHEDETKEIVNELSS